MFSYSVLPRLISRTGSRCFASSSNKTPPPVAVVGAPYWRGQSKFGTELGPDALRAFGLLNKLTDIHQSNVIDLGNLHFGPDSNLELPQSWPSDSTNNKDAYLLAQMVKQLSSCVSTCTDSEYLPLVLGGDHSIAVGSVLGTCAAKRLQGQDISLLWIDAHADANTEESSKSGHYHGMPVSFLVKEVPSSKNPIFANLPLTRLLARNVAFIGLRDVEIQELELMQKLKITYFSMEHVDRLGKWTLYLLLKFSNCILLA